MKKLVYKIRYHVGRFLLRVSSFIIPEENLQVVNVKGCTITLQSPVYPIKAGDFISVRPAGNQPLPHDFKGFKKGSNKPW